MSASDPKPRLAFLTRVVRNECRHLLTTDQRLFDQPFSAERAETLEADPDLAERVEAFVGRFGRLQDTVGDKLLPAIWPRSARRPAPPSTTWIAPSDSAGWIPPTPGWRCASSVTRWSTVHAYVEDPALLSSALETAHGYVPRLIAIAERLASEAQGRGWV